MSISNPRYNELTQPILIKLDRIVEKLFLGILRFPISLFPFSRYGQNTEKGLPRK